MTLAPRVTDHPTSVIQRVKGLQENDEVIVNLSKGPQRGVIVKVIDENFYRVKIDIYPDPIKVKEDLVSKATKARTPLVGILNGLFLSQDVQPVALGFDQEVLKTLHQLI